MNTLRAPLLFLIVFTLSYMPAFCQMPQDYWYVENMWGSGGTNDGQFNQPWGIAVDTNGLVYVVDTFNNRIQVFQSDGTFVRKWGSSGYGDSQFVYPAGIAVGTNGLIYVAGNNSQNIQVFQSDGTFVRRWGGVYYPYGIAVGTNGLIYVADSGNSRIQVFQSDGTFVTTWGSAGSGNGQFNWPLGIVVGSDGLIYVTDNDNYRIQVFQPNGAYVRKWDSGGVKPFAITMDADGLIYVTDTGGSGFRVYQSDGTFVRAVSIASKGIAVGTNGLVYVTDQGKSRILVLRRGYRTSATGMPLPEIMTVTQRTGAAYVDIDYTVWDSNSQTVQVAALGFSNGVVSLDGVVRLATFLEGTSSNVGTNIAPNVSHRITWDAGADWKVSSGNMKFEILANDGRPMVDFHFITIPSNGPNPELEIERFPMREADFQSCWYWLIATRDPAIDFRTNKVYGVSGSYTDKILAQTTTTTADGRAFLYERLHVREATTAEVARVRSGTIGTTNQWTPRHSTDRRTKYNEFGFDSAYTQGASVWYVVPNP